MNINKKIELLGLNPQKEEVKIDYKHGIIELSVIPFLNELGAYKRKLTQQYRDMVVENNNYEKWLKKNSFEEYYIYNGCYNYTYFNEYTFELKIICDNDYNYLVIICDEFIFQYGGDVDYIDHVLNGLYININNELYFTFFDDADSYEGFYSCTEQENMNTDISAFLDAVCYLHKIGVPVKISQNSMY